MSKGPLFLLGLLLGCVPHPRDITQFALAPVQPGQNLLLPLLLAPIDSAPGYMSKDMLYRLSYADNQLHPYSYSGWNAPPIDLFASVMRQAGNNLLTPDQSNQPAHCALHIELTHFEQVFTDGQNSHAELDLNFSLMQLRNNRELARSKLHFEIPAQTADARGGVSALEKASQQAASQIIEWLNHSFTPGASGTNPLLAACKN